MRVRLMWWCCSFGFLVGRLVDMGRFGRLELVGMESFGVSGLGCKNGEGLVDWAILFLFGLCSMEGFFSAYCCFSSGMFRNEK